MSTASVSEARHALHLDRSRDGSLSGKERYPTRLGQSCFSESFIRIHDIPSVVFPEWIAQLPWWFSVGIAGGAGVSVLIAGVFVVANRLSPTPQPDPSERVDGTERRRAEIRTYLGMIDEPYLEEYTLYGESIAFYLPRRDVAITFDAKAYFRLLDAGAYTILCEHEMPGVNLGRRLPFETPEIGFGRAATGDDTEVDDAFDQLGLTSNADQEAVIAAYRRKIKDVHPDHGGDPDRFRQVHQAYTTAKDAAD